MAIVIPEYILESVFRDAFTLIRKHPEKLDDLMAMYKYDFMNKQYGQQSINKMKEYVKENHISILFSWSDIPSKIPCITITSLINNEAQDNAYLGDYGRTEDVASDPEIITASILPSSYSDTTGWVDFDPVTINIDSINTISHVYKDASDATHSITAIINTDTRKAINVGRSAGVDVSSAGSVVGVVTFTRSRYLEVPVDHQITVSIHTEDAFLTKNLYYIVAYTLLSEKKRLTDRGLVLSTFNAREFARDLEKLPEHIYTQSIDVYGKTFFDWLETTDKIASGLGDKIRVPKDIYPRDGGDILNVTTSDESQSDE